MKEKKAEALLKKTEYRILSAYFLPWGATTMTMQMWTSPRVPHPVFLYIYYLRALCTTT